MKEPNHTEIDHLIQACLDDELTESEAGRLSALLEASEEARTRYWELASIHGLLEQTLQQASLKVVTGEMSPPPRKPGMFSLRNPLTTAAAGILVGIFFASIVWASTVPSIKKPSREKVSLLFESFESQSLQPIARVPDIAGQWYGNFKAGISLPDGRSPHRGEYVAEFIPLPTRKFSNAWYIVDLEDAEGLDPGQVPLELEVIASFSSSKPELPAHYQIRLAAFAQDPAGIRPIWNNETALFNTVLQHLGRNEIVNSPERDWTKLRASLEIPPGSRSLLISLAAAGDDPEVKHFLDAVRVNYRVASGSAQIEQLP